MTTEKTCLVVIDGWGFSDVKEGNAVAQANTPVMDELHKKYPNRSLAAHGLSVGLPDGLMGNSEVGHLNIGAGRVVYQDIVRIDLAVKNNNLLKQENFQKAMDRAKASGKLHLIGLVSDGGVHAHIEHLKNMLSVAKDYGVKSAFVHFFADGRDTSPRSAAGYLTDLLNFMDEIQYGCVATITGRYYAMDRDKRWERVKLAYDALTKGEGEVSSDLVETIKQRYAKDETDEFLKPIIGNKDGIIQDGDTIVCFNFRSDRMREMSQALGIAPLPFDGSKPLKDLSITTMTRYKTDFPFPNIFPPQTMVNVMAEWLGAKKIPQVHVAETEKYAHVTFFFNGGTEAQYDLEDRDMVPSPKVATYDLKPEMSAIEVGHQVASRIRDGKHPFVMCNFAPPDMVGHTGVCEAAIKGVEATDTAIGIIHEACKESGTILFVTADHGNAEQMLAHDGVTPHTAHTCNRVPFVMTSDRHEFIEGSESDALCDVAPTVLQVMGLSVPSEMDGRSLLKTIK